MPDTLMSLSNEPVIEDSNFPRKERQEKEFPKEEEEENERKEKEEEDSSEDIEIKEECSKHNPTLSSTTAYLNRLPFNEEKLLNSSFGNAPNFFLQSHPPFYILFACLKIDFQLI
jgi:hypothetical protein